MKEPGVLLSEEELDIWLKDQYPPAMVRSNHLPRYRSVSVAPSPSPSLFLLTCCRSLLLFRWSVGNEHGPAQHAKNLQGSSSSSFLFPSFFMKKFFCVICLFSFSIVLAGRLCFDPCLHEYEPQQARAAQALHLDCRRIQESLYSCPLVAYIRSAVIVNL